MRHFGWALLALTAVLCWGCDSGEGYHRQGYDFYQIDTIAVVDVAGPVGGEAVKNQIGDFFVMELLKKGYSPIERAQVQTLLNEQGFQNSEFSSSENVAEAGELLKVSTLMFINIPKFGDEISINAKLVNTENGSILWMGSGSGKSDEGMTGMFDAITGIFGGDEDEEVSNDSATGQQLTPETKECVREIVKKICKTLPRR